MGGDAVAAGLVAGKVGPVQQRHPQRRVDAQRPDGGGCTGRPGAHDGQVPRLHAATTVSSTTSTSAMAMAA